MTVIKLSGLIKPKTTEELLDDLGISPRAARDYRIDPTTLILVEEGRWIEWDDFDDYTKDEVENSGNLTYSSGYNISVIEKDGQYEIIDGLHRAAYARTYGDDEFLVNVYKVMKMTI